MPALERIRFAAVILAAGASSRMGQPKLLLSWRSTTVLGYLISQWRLLGSEQIGVVSAPGPHPVHEELDRLHVPELLRIINPTPELGMFSSIQAAARSNDWNSAVTHFVLLLGDQPQITATTLASLLEYASRNPERICQ